MTTEAATPPDTRLRQAAALLRERATETTPPPWRHDAPWWHDAPLTGDATPTGLVTGDGPNRTAVLLGVPSGEGHERTEANLNWAATLHPGIAEPLAAWLDLMARIAEFAAERGYRTSTQTDAALAVADVILAGGDHA